MTHPSREQSRILTWMCILIAVNQLGFGAVVATVALYARSFGVGQSAIGMAIASYGLARFLIAAPIGQLADGLGRRATLALGGLVTAVGNLLCAWAPTYGAFIAARFVAGAGAGLVLTTGQIILADITTPARRGRTMAVYQGVFLFAVGIGPFPGGVLAERFGLRAPFAVYAVGGAFCALLAWLRIPETRSRRYAGEPEREPAHPAFAAQLRLLAGKLGFVLVGAVSFMSAFARTGALFSVIPVLAQTRLSLTADRIGFGLALASLVGLALMYPSGVFVDRYGRKAVIVPATLMSGVSLMVFLVASSYAWFLLGCVAWSIAAGVSAAAPAAYAADAAPPGMNAAAMSAYRMVADLGYVIGPITLGVATDLLGADLALGATAALLVVAALLFARLAPETYRATRF